MNNFKKHWCSEYYFIHCIYWHAHAWFSRNWKNSILILYFLNTVVQWFYHPANSNKKNDICICSQPETNRSNISTFHQSILQSRSGNLVRSKIVDYYINHESFPRTMGIIFIHFLHWYLEPLQASTSYHLQNIFSIVKSLCFQIKVLEPNMSWKWQNITNSIHLKDSNQNVPYPVPFPRN